MKRTILLTVIIFTIFSLVTAGQGGLIRAEDFNLPVKSAILIEVDTGQVLFEENADHRLPPASITKVMTLLLAMEKIEQGQASLQDEVTISKHAESMGGSQIFLAADTRVKMGDLLKAVTMASANDAAVAVAEHLAGTYGNFIGWMNKKAEEMGMKNSHFVNSTGLPTDGGEHYSTARDISIMARELVKYPQILKWASEWVDYIQLPQRKAMLVNTNSLIKDYPGMDGLKTGHTDAAGFCLVATAEHSNTRLISVVLGASTPTEREDATTRLLDYGFNTFSKEIVVQKGTVIQNIDVPEGKKLTTTAETADNLYVVVKRGAQSNPEKKIIIKSGLKAPIKKGDVLGTEVVYQDGKELGRVNLAATEDIQRAGFITRLWRSFVNWVGSLFG